MELIVTGCLPIQVLQGGLPLLKKCGGAVQVRLQDRFTDGLSQGLQRGQPGVG